jgi:hypothetical protein
MNIPRFLIVSLIAIALLAPTAWAEKPESKGPVKILSVTQTLDGDSILLGINGENFTDGDVEPIVTIKGDLIMVVDDSWSAEFIAAEMPLKDPGVYLLEVMNHKGKTDDFHLTIREGQEGSEDDTSFLPLVISLVEVDTELHILTFHGHNFDPVAGVDTEVKLDDLLLNVTTVLDFKKPHSYNKIEAVLPEDFDPEGNYLLTVKTDEGMDNFDAYGLYLSVNEEDSREPLNQLVIDNAFVQYDDEQNKSYLTLSGQNFDNESWPPIVKFGDKKFTVIVDPKDENASDPPSRIVAYYQEGEELEIDPDTTLDPVLVMPQTGDSTENYDAWIAFSDESPPPSPPNHWFEEGYWKECFRGGEDFEECLDGEEEDEYEIWTDTTYRRKGPYPVCFQLTKEYQYDLKDTFPHWLDWPYENLPTVADPRYLPGLLIYAFNPFWTEWMYNWAAGLPAGLPFYDADSKDEKKYFVAGPEGVLYLKKGYRWDGPTPPKKKKKPKDYKEILMRASLVHDTVYDLMRMEVLIPDKRFLSVYRDGFENQRVADNSFYSICLEDGAKRYRCGGWWWGIRVGGAYATHKAVADWKSHALAHAGDDHTDECGSKKGVEITLDGRESRYADADKYTWTWKDKGVCRQAVGVLVPDQTFHQDPSPDGTVKDVTETVVTLTVDLDPDDAVNKNNDLLSKRSKDLDDVKITVNPDLEDPVITGISEPLAMWPPEHQYLTYTIEDFVYSVSDNCADISLDDLKISQVTSDEPEDAKADGHTKDDMVISSDGRSVKLRAERQGGGNGRVYTITVVAKDDNENVGRGLFQVIVPASIKDKVVDDGPIYHVSF